MNAQILRNSVAVLFLCGMAKGEESNNGFASIFDGESLKGWREAPKGRALAWSVKDGVIHGARKEDRQVYLIYSGDESPKDFELELSDRLPTKGNMGVETRARVDKTGKRGFGGYHADPEHVGNGDGILGAWDFHCGKGTRNEFP